MKAQAKIYGRVHESLVQVTCARVKAFSIIPEFRNVRLTFHIKSASKSLNRQIVMAFEI